MFGIVSVSPSLDIVTSKVYRKGSVGIFPSSHFPVTHPESRLSANARGFCAAEKKKEYMNKV